MGNIRDAHCRDKVRRRLNDAGWQVIDSSGQVWASGVTVPMNPSQVASKMQCFVVEVPFSGKALLMHVPGISQPFSFKIPEPPNEKDDEKITLQAMHVSPTVERDPEGGFDCVVVQDLPILENNMLAVKRHMAEMDRRLKRQMGENPTQAEKHESVDPICGYLAA